MDIDDRTIVDFGMTLGNGRMDNEEVVSPAGMPRDLVDKEVAVARWDMD